MAFKVYAVRLDEGGWPPKVWVVFASADVAHEYVKASRGAFRVETMPLYQSYEECPIQNKDLGVGLNKVALHSLGFADGRARQGWTDLDDAQTGERVVYAIAAHDADRYAYTEAQLFYTTQDAAEKHVANSYPMASVVPFEVHRSHETPLGHRRSARI